MNDDAFWRDAKRRCEQRTVHAPNVVRVDDSLWLTCRAAAVNNIEGIIVRNFDVGWVLGRGPLGQFLVALKVGAVFAISQDIAVVRDRGQIGADGI